MNWQDKGYLLSLNKYNENSSIAEFYTENNGKIVGVIFGSTSKKIKPAMIEIPPKVRPTGYPKRIKTITIKNKKRPALSITYYFFNLFFIWNIHSSKKIQDKVREK